MTGAVLQSLLEETDTRQREASLVRRWSSFLGQGDTHARQNEIQQVLARLVQAGYLGVTPEHHEDNRSSGSYLQVMVGKPSTINSRTRRGGKACLDGLEDPVLGRWTVLLHEASHQEHLLLAKSTQMPGVGQGMGRILSDWSLGGWGGGKNHLMGMLGENFADAYAYMLMSRSLEPSERLDKALTQLIESRRKDEKRADQLFKELLVSGELEHLERPTSIHRTYLTLQRVKQQHEHWQSLDPEELRAAALTMAEEGLRDTLDPERVSNDGFPIGLAMRYWTVPAEPGGMLRAIMSVLGRSYLDGANVALLDQEVDNLPDKYIPVVRQALPVMVGLLKKRGSETSRMESTGNYTDSTRDTLLDVLWEDMRLEEGGDALIKAEQSLLNDYQKDRARFMEGFLIEPMASQPQAQAFIGLRHLLETAGQPLEPAQAKRLKPAVR